MTRCSRPRPSGWRNPAVWIAGLCLTWTGLSGTALAAGEGEACGRLGFWHETCDEGLRCKLERRSRFFSFGVCVRPSCGGLTGEACPDGQYCDFAADAGCGFADQTGTCRPQPEICTQEYQPVCGCDGVTYGNACTAHAAGVSVAREGACEWCQSDDDCPHGRCEAGTTCAGIECPPAAPPTCTVCGDGSELICLALPAPCPDGQVREIVEGCYGACVDRATCKPGSGSCEYDGRKYAPGESFPSTDGCNTCTCGEDGLVACTERACDCNYEDPQRSYISKDAAECATIQFLCAEGYLPFFGPCGCGCEVACRVGGCSGQLCVAPGEPDISTCEWRDEYACYWDATCELQADGSCGWTETDELRECLANPPRPE